MYEFFFFNHFRRRSISARMKRNRDKKKKKAEKKKNNVLKIKEEHDHMEAKLMQVHRENYILKRELKLRKNTDKSRIRFALQKYSYTR